MNNTVHLTINGISVETPVGTSILEAAAQSGIEIPHLCKHPLLPARGACRLCLVEVEGARTFAASCTTPAAEGMVVRTETEKIRQARRMVLDLLLSDHCVDCITCEKNGDCRLQDYAYEYDINRTSFVGETTSHPPDDTNPFFIRDHRKCILCGICVSTCSRLVGNSVYTVGYRSFEARIVAGADRNLQDTNCVFCGNCITNCPTGALQPKLGKGQGRIYSLEQVSTTCAYCGVGCSMKLQVKGQKIVGAVPEDGPANANLLCVKGRFGWDYIQHPDRLTTPLVRKKDKLVEATWEEALALVAEKLLGLKEKYGPDALGVMSSAKCTNEENYLLQKLTRAVLGTNNIDNSARLCHASTIAGLYEAFGSGAATNSLAEMDQTGVFLIIGSNTAENHPVISYRIHQAQLKGAKVIVADPRRTEFADKADLYLQHLPGTDVALLNGLLHIIIRDGLTDEEFIRERTESFAEVRAKVERYTPEFVEGLTGVPAAKLEEAAKLYSESETSAILYAMGITQHTTGTDNVRAVANLAMATGNVGREFTGVYPLRGQNNVQGACDMGALPKYLPGYQRLDNPDVLAKFGQAWGREIPTTPGLTEMDMLEEACAGKVKALYIMGENPMMSNPDLHTVEKALQSLDFLVVQDIFLTETAKMADVVLPGTTFAEKDGTFSNTERRVQLIRKAISPVGQSLSDWEIICRLSAKMGYPMEYSSPAAVMEEIAALTPSYGGMTYERLEQGGLQWPCSDAQHPGTRFLHNGRFTRGKGLFGAVEFIPPAELPDREFPLTLVTGRHLYHYHTGSMSRRSYGLETARPEAYAEINPHTAKSLGIQEGEVINLQTRRGKIAIKAALTRRVPEKVVFVPFHYQEAAANLLTNAATDPKSQIPELKVCAVKIAKLPK